jgi:cation diffusion facilitator family transporter
MTPQRRTALVSVVAAGVLVAIKLATAVATDSLGFLSEALHSGSDLVAALLTLFAVGVAVRPADSAHAYGHGKAEHLAALAEATLLVVASLVVAGAAVRNLVGDERPGVEAPWWAFAVIALVLAIDASRMIVSGRAARRYESPALGASALHFASDFAGTSAVLVGLVLVANGYPKADSAAALFVAALVLLAAGRLIRRNVDVLMDRTPAAAQEAALRAIESMRPPVDVRRLRVREAAGRHFADVVIGVSPGAAVGQGHAAADAVEAAVQGALPESDVVVHVEPAETDAAVRERALAAAHGVARVREIHNVSVLTLAGRTEVSLHLKLPGELTLEEAHEVAEAVERAICAAVPEVDAVQTHLEPLAEGARGTEDVARADADLVRRVVRDATGQEPRELRFLDTDDGLVAFLTLGLDPAMSLADAHARASEIEARIRDRRPEIADVIVHTEP